MPDLNRRPLHPQCSALPDCATSVLLYEKYNKILPSNENFKLFNYIKIYFLFSQFLVAENENVIQTPSGVTHGIEKKGYYMA